jgi:hypothetical protein
MRAVAGGRISNPNIEFRMKPMLVLSYSNPAWISCDSLIEPFDCGFFEAFGTWPEDDGCSMCRLNAHLGILFNRGGSHLLKLANIGGLPTWTSVLKKTLKFSSKLVAFRGCHPQLSIICKRICSSMHTAHYIIDEYIFFQWMAPFSDPWGIVSQYISWNRE